MKHKDFAVFILTHGRANKVITYNTLKRFGYTGDIYLIVDNEDDQVEEYRTLYGNNVIVFDKLNESLSTDAGDNFTKRNSVLYARNACFTIAEKLGIRYFLQLDDDYQEFYYKTDTDLNYKERHISCLDAVFDAYLDFLITTGCKSIAMAQQGDFIGGKLNNIGISLKRKCMNSFFCDVQNPFKFIGRMNDDVNTYTLLGKTGEVFFTYTLTSINQKDTQTNQGGLTDMYKEFGTYVKSFYTVMMCPSSVFVHAINSTHQRIHHRTKWNFTVPKIISEAHKK